MRRFHPLLASLLAPPRCATCAQPCELRAVLCASCERRLSVSRPAELGSPPGLDVLWSASAYDGIAQELVSALKFRRLLLVAERLSEEIMARSPRKLWSGALVPVPPAPSRLRTRGFDPAEALAAALARQAGLPISRCLAREDGPRQVGRPRAQRLARPPQVRLLRQPPPELVLIDDVCTTGATLRRCAIELRRGGAERVAAVTFARTP